jgi:SnoaL-like protein
VSSDPFRTAVEAGDLEAMVACLSDDVILHSPVTFRPFEGKDAIRALFGALIKVFEDFTYIDEVASGGLAILVFKARIGSRLVEGVDILRRKNGLINDFTVMVRPLSAALALADNVAAHLGLQGGTPPSE